MGGQAGGACFTAMGPTLHAILGSAGGSIRCIAGEEKKQQTVLYRNACQRVITPCTACPSHTFLFQHAYVLGV